MEKNLNYDDLAGFKTAMQRKKEGQVKIILTDIKKIDLLVETDDFEQLKKLHRELDGTYQNQIKNWGTSMYNYIKDVGFTYDYIGVSSLKDNLKTMKAKLRSLLFEIAPDIEGSMEDAEGKRSMGNFQISAKQKQLLVDYAQIKQFTAGNMAISIQNEDYPRFKDTLEYMVEYEFIIPADVDFGFGIDHMYFKQPAFETFTEHVLTQEMEEEPKVVRAYSGKKVFIVHGHDHQLLDEVELMLRRIGLEPIIVKNEANAGRTIIEKIEDLTDVGFGIVLYTCCDEGRKKGDSDLKDRARQNVIFEHGYLYAKLGRGRVAALNDDGIEISSDLSGVLYISHVTSDWKNQLMREMKEAGLDFDSTKA